MNIPITNITIETVQKELNQQLRKVLTLLCNERLEEDCTRLLRAGRHEQTEKRQGYRAGHVSRNLLTMSGPIELQVPKVKGVTFQTDLYQRYQRTEEQVNRLSLGIFLRGVSTRQVEELTGELWDTPVSKDAVSRLTRKLYKEVEAWRSRPLTGHYAYVLVDAIYLKCRRKGQVGKLAIFIAMGMDEDGHWEVLGAEAGGVEDKATWKAFLQGLKDRGLTGVRLVVGDGRKGLADAVWEVIAPEGVQRCAVHFMRNVYEAAPGNKAAEVARWTRMIYHCDSLEAAHEAARTAVEKITAMGCKKAARILAEGYRDTLVYMAFPREHWSHIYTTNLLERLNAEIKRRTRSMGPFPNEDSALNLVCARILLARVEEWTGVPVN